MSHDTTINSNRYQPSEAVFVIDGMTPNENWRESTVKNLLWHNHPNTCKGYNVEYKGRWKPVKCNNPAYTSMTAVKKVVEFRPLPPPTESKVPAPMPVINKLDAQVPKADTVKLTSSNAIPTNPIEKPQKPNPKETNDNTIPSKKTITFASFFRWLFSCFHSGS